MWTSSGDRNGKKSLCHARNAGAAKNRVEDYVARALCEASTSEKVATVTLTYAPRDDLADKILHPKHFQLFMKLLRRSGHEVRYLVAGEYGDLRGPHAFSCDPLLRGWPKSCLLMLPCITGIIWPILSPLNHSETIYRTKRIAISASGHTATSLWIGPAHQKQFATSANMCCQTTRTALGFLSPKPALGAAWFAQKAEQAKSLGVLPSTFAYAAPGNESNKHPSVMSGATRRDYLNAITQDPEDKPRMSETTLKTFEKHERARLMDHLYSQPAEVQEKAFLDRMEQQEDQARLMRIGAKFREASENEDALLSSNGVLRLVGGAGHQTRKVSHERTQPQKARQAKGLKPAPTCKPLFTRKPPRPPPCDPPSRLRKQTG